jgi:hypothetical protein
MDSKIPGFGTNPATPVVNTCKRVINSDLKWKQDYKKNRSGEKPMEQYRILLPYFTAP